MKVADIPEINRLSPPEKLLLVEALWDDVRDESNLPLPGWHNEALEESASDYKENPHGGRPWANVKAELLSRTE